jgi:hypothetical protein
MYDKQVREVEYGSFAPLVLSTSGGMGSAAEVVYKRIPSMIATKLKKHYSTTINYIRCKLTFSLFRSAIMCLWGHCRIFQHPNANINSIDVAISEGRISTDV